MDKHLDQFIYTKVWGKLTFLYIKKCFGVTLPYTSNNIFELGLYTSFFGLNSDFYQNGGHFGVLSLCF